MSAGPMEIEDFSGGITDNYIGGRPNQYRQANNLLITTDRKLESRSGSELYDITNPQVPNGQQRILSLMPLDADTIIQNALRKLYFIEGGVFNDLLGPTGNPALTDGDATSMTSFSTWNKFIYITNSAFSWPIKVYRDQGDVARLRSAGLPALATTPVVTAGAAGTGSYLYTFVPYVQYQSGDQIFEDFGPVTEVLLDLAQDPSVSPVAITGIPTFSNGATENVDTANLKIKIYRTTDAGDVSYEIGEVANGVAVFADNFSDDAIQLLPGLYTNTGGVSYTRPPRCKYVHITNGVAYYAHIKVGAEIIRNRVRTSVQNDPDAVPEEFILEVDDEITGMGSFEHTPIIFCTKHIYRVDGGFTEDLGQAATRQRINDTVGCVSNNSIVHTPWGTFFAGNDGFYWTDAYKVVKISDELNVRYRALANKGKIYGAFDEKNSRIWWAVQQDSASLDVDSCWILDLRQGVKPDAAFTSASGGENFAPTAMLFVDGELVRGDKRGYLFQHGEAIFSDPLINTLVSPSTWKETAIIWDYVSCAWNFGTTFMRKWVTRISVTLRNETNLSLQIFGINDDGRRTQTLKPIRFRGNLTWGDELFVWGNADFVWNLDGLIDEWRFFPAKGLRCNYKQVQFTNAFVNLFNSDSYGDAVVDSVGKTVSLSDVWPSNIEDYYISFENDGHQREYLVSSVSGGTLVYEDSGNESTAGTMGWIIRGKPKNEVFSLVGFCIHYEVLGKTQLGYRSSGSGDNA